VRATQRVTAQFDAVGAVEQPVEDGIGDGRLAERLVPVADGQLAGDEPRRGEEGDEVEKQGRGRG
jgi:hypothetical protein